MKKPTGQLIRILVGILLCLAAVGGAFMYDRMHRKALREQAAHDALIENNARVDEHTKTLEMLEESGTYYENTSTDTPPPVEYDASLDATDSKLAHDTATIVDEYHEQFTE